MILLGDGKLLRLKPVKSLEQKTMISGSSDRQIFIYRDRQTDRQTDRYLFTDQLPDRQTAIQTD